MMSSITLNVQGMRCAGCAANLQKALRNKSGVKSAEVYLATHRATIIYDGNLCKPDDLIGCINQMGFTCSKDDLYEDEHKDTQWRKNQKKLLLKTLMAIVLAVPVCALMFVKQSFAWHLVSAVLSSIIVFFCGWSFHKSTYSQIRNLRFGMDTLVSVSTLTAYLFSVFQLFFPNYLLKNGIHPHFFFDASAMIITFILLGRWLESTATRKTTDSINRLVRLRPSCVSIMTEAGTSRVDISAVKVGDRITAKSGEYIAVDGKVVSGYTYVDQSMLNGEPMPIYKTVGDDVFAGTVHINGKLIYEAIKTGQDTMLSQIIRMVRQASESKPPIQQLTDKIASVFVPMVIVAASLAFVIWMLLGGSDALAHAIWVMVTTLVIACPCALGLATPTAVIAGMGRAAACGILIRDARALQTAADIDTVVCDKTGTLTEGFAQVSNEIWLKDSSYLKQILCGVEQTAEHPLAKAILSLYPHCEAISVDDYQNQPGLGVKALYNGVFYHVGSIEMINENGIFIPSEIRDRLQEWMDKGQSVVCFADEKELLAVFGLTDKIKQNTLQAVMRLKQIGLSLYMLSGDKESPTATVAHELGIKDFRFNMLPQDKADFIRQLQGQNHRVAMVGDGVNDTVALGQADVGMAMSGGSDISMSHAMVTILNSRLTSIIDLILISRATRRTIRQNLFWAFIYNVLSIPLAAGVLYPLTGKLLDPMMGAAMMALSSVCVVTNSLLLSRRPNTLKKPI